MELCILLSMMFCLHRVLLWCSVLYCVYLALCCIGWAVVKYLLCCCEGNGTPSNSCFYCQHVLLYFLLCCRTHLSLLCMSCCSSVLSLCCREGNSSLCPNCYFCRKHFFFLYCFAYGVVRMRAYVVYVVLQYRIGHVRSWVKWCFELWLFFCLVFLAVVSHFTARVAFDGHAKQVCVVCLAKFGRAVCWKLVACVPLFCEMTFVFIIFFPSQSRAALPSYSVSSVCISARVPCVAKLPIALSMKRRKTKDEKGIKQQQLNDRKKKYWLGCGIPFVL